MVLLRSDSFHVDGIPEEGAHKSVPAGSTELSWEGGCKIRKVAWCTWIAGVMDFLGLWELWVLISTTLKLCAGLFSDVERMAGLGGWLVEAEGGGRGGVGSFGASRACRWFPGASRLPLVTCKISNVVE